MKIQILPNWFKKVGLVLFIVGSIIGFGDNLATAFKEGANEAGSRNSKPFPISESTFFTSTFGENIVHIFYILSLVGMIIYIMSKEKVEDDYINKLRLESYQLTALFSLLVALILFVFSSQLKFNIDDFITNFLFIYLITFFIKKRIDL